MVVSRTSIHVCLLKCTVHLSSMPMNIKYQTPIVRRFVVAIISHMTAFIGACLRRHTWNESYKYTCFCVIPENVKTITAHSCDEHYTVHDYVCGFTHMYVSTQKLQVWVALLASHGSELLHCKAARRSVSLIHVIFIPTGFYLGKATIGRHNACTQLTAR